MPGRMYPDSVSVASSSFGWLTLTTRRRKSWTVSSLGAPSSRARRSTSCRTSPDTAISTGISSSSPRSAGGRMRSLRTSVLAWAAISLTSFCSSDAATAGVADVRNRAETALARSVRLRSSASITPLRAIRSRLFSSICSRAGTRSPARRFDSRIGSTTNDQPPSRIPTRTPAAMTVRSRRERLAIMDGGLLGGRAVVCREPAAAGWGVPRAPVAPRPPRRAWGASPPGTRAPVGRRGRRLRALALELRDDALDAADPGVDAPDLPAQRLEPAVLAVARDQERGDRQDEGRREHSHRDPLRAGEPPPTQRGRDQVQRSNAPAGRDGDGELALATRFLRDRGEAPLRARRVGRARDRRAEREERSRERVGLVAGDPDRIARPPAGDGEA